MPDRMPPRASRWLRFLRWVGWVPQQSTCVWCPECGNELVSCPDSKHTYPERDDVVVYGCAICGKESAWLFDAPVPLLLEPRDHAMMIYFGCYGEPGHYFYQAGPFGSQSVNRTTRQTFPWTDAECDGNLQPGTAEMKKSYDGQRPRTQVEGVCRIHHKGSWTAMAFWDRSGDRRGNSCSVVMIDRECNFAEMVDAFRIEFPSIYARCTAKFELVEEPHEA